MNKVTTQSGIALLLFAIIISATMMLCLSVWKATTYFFDFSCEKERCLQQRACVEGIMRWALYKTQDLGKHQSPSLTIDIKNWPFVLENFKGAQVAIMIRSSAPTIRNIEVVVTKEDAIVAQGSCTVMHTQRNGTFAMTTQSWNLVV